MKNSLSVANLKQGKTNKVNNENFTRKLQITTTSCGTFQNMRKHMANITLVRGIPNQKCKSE